MCLPWCLVVPPPLNLVPGRSPPPKSEDSGRKSGRSPWGNGRHPHGTMAMSELHPPPFDDRV